MAVQTGDQAPDFTLYTDEKNEYHLADERGGKSTVLFFFPGAFTSVCTSEMCTVNDDLAEYRNLDAQVVGISADAPAVLSEFKKQNDLDFPLLSDHHGNVSEKYGAQFSTEEHNLGYDRVAKRAAFVVDSQGVIRYAEVLDNPLNMPDFDAIQRTLQELQ